MKLPPKFIVVVLALTASSLWAQDGLEGALSRVSLTSPADLAAPFSRRLAAADFDGDNKLDGAILVDYGWPPQSGFRRIELHFTGRGNTELTFQSNESTLAVSALDVNRDGAPDIVVEQLLTHKRLYVWLGDGHGGFHQGRTEDFPPDRKTTGDWLDSASPGADTPAVCFVPQRNTQIAKLAAQPPGILPPSSRDFERPSATSLPPSPGFSLSHSRAPPSIAL
jgi:hypothetical protein